MISVEQVISIHEILVNRFGGASGLRDLAQLESALARPYQTFGGKELHQHEFQKAAAILESLLINHPFIDGNKRMGFVVMRLLLLEKGWDLKATQNERYLFVIDVASGKMAFKEIVEWIQFNAIRNS